MAESTDDLDGFKLRRIHLHKNQLIYDAGEPAMNVYRVDSGCVRLQESRNDGERQVIAFCFPGDVFGLECNCPRLHAAEATMASDLTVYSMISRDRSGANPEGAAGMARAACEMISRLTTHITGLGLVSAEDRVQWFLDWLAANQQVCCTGGIVDLPMNRGDIADFLNLAPETLSRAISRLVDRRRVRLIDSRRIQLRPAAQDRSVTARLADSCGLTQMKLASS